MPMTQADILTADEMTLLRNQMVKGWGPAAIRDRVLLELLLTTGMLVEELVALQVEDLDLIQATVRVCCPPSTVRVLPLSRRLCQLLPPYLDWRAAHGTGTAPHTRLFCTVHGDRLTADALTQQIRYWGTLAGLSRPLRSSAFRGTFATRLFSMTRNALLVWETLGTLRYHAALRHIHLEGAARDDALEQL